MSSSGRIPNVRYFIPCDEARRWQGGGPFCLTRIRRHFHIPSHGPQIRTVSELWFYLQMAGGTGSHTFRIQQVCLQDQTLIYPWPTFTLDLGTNPSTVYEGAIPLRDVVFWRPGQYEFVLSVGSRQLATAEIDVR